MAWSEAARKAAAEARRRKAKAKVMVTHQKGPATMTAAVPRSEYAKLLKDARAAYRGSFSSLGVKANVSEARRLAAANATSRFGKKMKAKRLTKRDATKLPNYW